MDPRFADFEARIAALEAKAGIKKGAAIGGGTVTAPKEKK